MVRADRTRATGLTRCTRGKNSRKQHSAYHVASLERFDLKCRVGVDREEGTKGSVGEVD